jgi:hypothetical protein
MIPDFFLGGSAGIFRIAAQLVPLKKSVSPDPCQ